ncbi:hypothetical protein ACFW9O_24920 [Streptomyces sp. NPDC059499]|uniref:hypothetical protein n=1 Tax=Streptomyces sp. NPDC059499 TaxID=3346852 RepID=UPI0036781CD2
MPIPAGGIVTAGQLARMQPVVNEATGSSNLALTTTEADVAGATITLTTTTANARYVVTGTFVFDITSATTALAEGILHVDGVQASGNARWSGEVTTDFGTAAQQWSGILASAGSHTLKLRGVMSSGTGIQVLGAFTRIIATVYEVV